MFSWHCSCIRLSSHILNEREIMKLCYFLIISTFFIAWAPCVNAKSKKHPCEYKRNKLCRKILTLKKNINKDQVIRLDDVELNLPTEVIEARDYQYNLI